MSDNEIQTKHESIGEIALAAANEEEGGLIAYVFTNNLGQAQFLQSFLDMFYRGAFYNTIGVMSALNTETDEEEVVLVGVEHTDDGNTLTYPLARILRPDEAPKYVGPDGKGGWLTPEVEHLDGI